MDVMGVDMEVDEVKEEERTGRSRQVRSTRRSSLFSYLINACGVHDWYRNLRDEYLTVVIQPRAACLEFPKGQVSLHTSLAVQILLRVPELTSRI